jgi:hypothetical protein
VTLRRTAAELAGDLDDDGERRVRERLQAP